MKEKKVLIELIAEADVFVQNFRPRTIDRMGFGEDFVRSIRGDIVYVSISGFGDEGPFAHQRVYDPSFSRCRVSQLFKQTVRLVGRK